MIVVSRRSMKCCLRLMSLSSYPEKETGGSRILQNPRTSFPEIGSMAPEYCTYLDRSTPGRKWKSLTAFSSYASFQLITLFLG